MEAPALFFRDGASFVATSFTCGPWDPAQTDGSSALALIAHCLDDVPSLVPMSTARFTVDLQRPVPVGRPLTVTTEITREGKKLQVVDAVIWADGQACVQATALRLREADFSGNPIIPTGTTDDVPSRRITPPEDSVHLRTLRPRDIGAIAAADLLYATRTDSQARATWVRLTTPVVADEPTRTFARMAYAFDFVSLVGMSIDSGTVTMINPDVNAQILRPAVGEWIALVGETRVEAAHGRGMSYALASDEVGVFATLSSSQFVEPRR